MGNKFIGLHKKNKVPIHFQSRVSGNLSRFVIHMYVTQPGVNPRPPLRIPQGLCKVVFYHIIFYKEFKEIYIKRDL